MTTNDTDDASELARSDGTRSDDVLVGFRDRNEPETDSRAAVVRSASGDGADDRQPVRIEELLAPLALATAYALVAGTTGFETFDTGSGGAAGPHAERGNR